MSNGKSVIKEIRLKILTSRVPPSRPLKVIGTDTDFLLTFHSNHWPIQYRF